MTLAPEKPANTSRDVRSWAIFALAMTALAIAFAIASWQYLRRYPMPPSAGIAIYCCFFLLLVLLAVPAVHVTRSAVANAFRGSARALFIPIWCLPYLVYAAGTGHFAPQALLRLLIIAAAIPSIYWIFPVSNLSRFSWQDALVSLWLILNILLHALRDIWTFPVSLDFMGRLFLIVIASWTWTFIRPVPGLGYRFVLSRRAFKAFALNFTLFAVIALPASLAMHFTRWNPHWRGSAHFVLDFLEIWLFIAVLEELFFRGFLQNLISKSLRAPWRGQLLVSCLFGLSHILHAPVPNWRYVALASLAGWFYGSAFRAGGNLTAASLTHAMVDTAWRTWLSKI